MAEERDIEKRLKAYAQKRRAGTADAFSLPPSVRRRLQAQVTQQYTPPPEEESISLWRLFRQEWATLTGFALIIFLAATLISPALQRTRKRSQEASAVLNLNQIGLAARDLADGNHGKLPVSLDALTNGGIVSENILTDPVSGKRFIYVAGGENLDLLTTNTMLAYSPEDHNGRLGLMADGTVQRLSGKEFSQRLQNQINTGNTPTVATGNSLAMDAVRAVPAAAPAAPPSEPQPQLAMAEAVSTDVGSDAVKAKRMAEDKKSRPTFLPPAAKPSLAANSAPATVMPLSVAGQPRLKDEARQSKTAGANQPGLSQRFRNTLSNPASTLNSFEVQLTDGQLAIVDADGSVYQGLSSTNSPVAAVLATATADGSGSVAANDHFQISGQNRTLNQAVVIAGHWVALEAPPTALRSVAKQSQASPLQTPAGNQLSQSFLLQNRLVGSLTIGGTNRIEINATPVAP